MSVIETIKAHPVPVIGGGLVLALLVSMRSSAAQGAGAPNMSATIASQQVAGQTDVALSGINADLQKTALTANAQTALQRAAIMGSLWNTQIQANTVLASQDKRAQVAEFLGALGYSQNMQALSDQTQLGHEQIQAGVDTASKQLDTAVKITQINGQNQVAAMNSPNFSSLMTHYENMAKIAGQNEIGLAQVNIQPALINAQANQTAASANANATNNSSSMDMLGGLFNIGASLFGF